MGHANGSTEVDRYVLAREMELTTIIQGGLSGCTLPFVDMKTKLPSQFTPLYINQTLNLMSTKCSVPHNGPPCIARLKLSECSGEIIQAFLSPVDVRLDDRSDWQRGID